MSIQDLQDWIVGLEANLDDRQKTIAKELLKEINDRLGFLLDVGLTYLSLDRPGS